MIFDTTTVDWAIVWIAIPIILASLSTVFVLKAMNFTKWQVRKIGHMIVHFVAAFLPYMFHNVFDIIVTILIVLGLLVLISLLPKIRFIPRIYDECTREGENIRDLVINSLLTSVTVAALFLWLQKEHMYIYTAAVLSVSLGDGMGEMIGRPFGKIRYKIFETRTLEGSIAVFIGIYISLIVAFGYNLLLATPGFWWKSLIISFIGTIIEACNYKFLDNAILPMTMAVIIYFTL
ncbi:MAG: hypothetical protein ACTSSG_14685 [Candidatus Heimdallarchaeaceae archaeon]